jgi:hypothetical protein
LHVMLAFIKMIALLMQPDWLQSRGRLHCAACCQVML